MKPFAEFLPLVRGDLGELERERARLHDKYVAGWWMMAALALVGGGGSFAIAHQGRGSPVWIGGAILTVIGLFAVYALRIAAPRAEYVAQFKARFLQPIAGACGLSYQPENYLSQPIYEASRIFRKDVDRYRGEDLLEGTLGATEIRMSELHTEYKTESTDSKGRRSTHWHTIFRGLFVEADFHKHFQAQTFIRPDVAESMFGALGRFFQKTPFSNEDLVQLEDPEFEKLFVVHSTDQVEARYILSTAMMRRILDLRLRFAADCAFSFVGSSMYMAISIKHDLFEPVFASSVLDENYLNGYYEQLGSCVRLVEDLGLNTRIWTKQ